MHNARALISTIWICVAIALFAIPNLSAAQTLVTLHSFDDADGASPFGGLIQATDGNFYGTTPSGPPEGYGTIFRITPSGALTTLHTFDLRDGAVPQAGLIQATDGNLYGTTELGGTRNGYGTVFKVSSSGMLSTLHSFVYADHTDGYQPYAGLIQASDGNFYGTTQAGGAYGQGTVFKITPDGTLTTLYSFCAQPGCADGSQPWFATLIQASDGDLYGTTESGGTFCGCGTVFKITTSGALTTLHSFDDFTDGYAVVAGLIQSSDGNFYGATGNGGPDQTHCINGCGTVFRITPSGALTTLHGFNGTDGGDPSALIQASDGNFYGTTAQGGSREGCFLGCGTVFKMTTSGELTTLYTFRSNGRLGLNPSARLLQATDGNFYGTTSLGGANGYGSVFGLSVSLGPFVAPQPTFASIGTPVRILGTKLTAASTVTFNGTPAPFKVVSPTFIKTVVPPEATTGYIEVTTPAGTLKSNVPFRVVQ